MDCRGIDLLAMMDIYISPKCRLPRRALRVSAIRVSTANWDQFRILKAMFAASESAISAINRI